MENPIIFKEKARQNIRKYKKQLESLTSSEENSAEAVTWYLNLFENYILLCEFKEAEAIAKTFLAKYPWLAPKMYLQLMKVYAATNQSVEQVTLLWRSCNSLVPTEKLGSRESGQLKFMTMMKIRDVLYASEEMQFLKAFSLEAILTPLTRSRLLIDMGDFENDKINIRHKDKLISLGEKLYAGNNNVHEELSLFVKCETFALAFLYFYPNIYRDVFYKGLKRLNDLHEARLEECATKYAFLLDTLHILCVNINPLAEHFFKIQNQLELIHELFRATMYGSDVRLAIMRNLTFVCFEPSNVLHLFKNFDMAGYFKRELGDIDHFKAASSSDANRHSRVFANLVFVIFKHADNSIDLHDVLGAPIFFKICKFLAQLPDDENEQAWIDTPNWVTFWEVICYRYPKSCTVLWDDNEFNQTVKNKLKRNQNQYVHLVGLFAKSDSKLRESIGSNKEIKSLLYAALPNDDYFLWLKMVKNLLYGEEFVLASASERTLCEREFCNLQHRIILQFAKLHCDPRDMFLRLDLLYFFVSKKKITTFWIQYATWNCYWLDCILFALDDFVNKKHDLSTSYPVYLKTTLLLFQLFLRDYRLRDVYVERKQVLLQFQTLVVRLYRLFCVTPNHVISELLLDVLVLM